MNQGTTAEAGRGAAAETCLCCEAQRLIAQMLRLPDPTRQHLRNARIEFLKAIRSLIDERIAQLARSETKGTKVAVE